MCSPERSVGYHDLAYTSTAEANALSEIKSLKTSSKLLLRLHGSFMVVAWIGAASIGIVVARYYRQTWVGGSCCAKDVWFGVSRRQNVGFINETNERQPRRQWSRRTPRDICCFDVAAV